MDDLKIKAFENSLEELCNKAGIPKRVEYFILIDVARRVLSASELEIQLSLQNMAQKKKEAEHVNE